MNSLVFFGNDRLATGVSTTVPTLRALVDAGYEVKSVILNQNEAVSRSRREPEIIEVAKARHIPVMVSEELGAQVDKISSLGADAGILTAYGQVLPAELLEIFPKGIVNIHPSLLPKYRGPTPIEQAILDGVSETGVSLMRLTEKLDAGPLLAQVKVELKGSETKQELADNLNQTGASLLVDKLPDVLNGKLDATAQDESAATYTERVQKSDGLIDWSKSSEQIEREVRAYAGWPKSRTKLKHFDVIITRVRVAENGDDGELVMKTGDGWLEIIELIAPSGRKITGAEFLRGYSSGKSLESNSFRPGQP